MGKKERKWSSFTNKVIVYVESPRIPKILSEQTNQLTTFQIYKVDTQKQTIFL